MSAPTIHDELTHTVLLAAQSLSVSQKADFLLQTALDMIEAGRCVACTRASTYIDIRMQIWR